MALSHFAEKSGIVPCNTDWGCWWQTVDEIHIEVRFPPDQPKKSRDVSLKIAPKKIDCVVSSVRIFQGTLFSIIHADEAIWTIEDGGRLLNIVLPKADYAAKDIIWSSLMEDGTYAPDALTFHEMRKKLDLEKFQIENPGMDFSKAKLSKCYDKIPESVLEKPEPS
ncbi:unnamed protein product [Bemisia tabaci]|uniref:CS domain-containing protein n=1 Tax=Bemisia tabaci TaxID=7038 RepID=A0A9P0F019_BEMTA|nr:unnamed protein product [Bemisia tabaci]